MAIWDCEILDIKCEMPEPMSVRKHTQKVFANATSNAEEEINTLIINVLTTES